MSQEIEFFPASTNVRGAPYPRVSADGRATLRLEAPQAREVCLHLAGGERTRGDGPFLMERNANGVWELMVTPKARGFHYYWFAVDRLVVNDPGSETFFGYGRQCSGMRCQRTISGIPSAAGCGSWRSALAGTMLRPPVHGDERWPIHRRGTRRARALPSAVSQHGGGEDERGWTTQAVAIHHG